MIETFKKFVDDPQAFEMFVTGQAGTGKTTSLAHLIEYCKENQIKCLVSAFTHKACRVLESKLPQGTEISTLHSFLNKRPSINEHATKKDHINVSRQHKEVQEAPQVLFLDEFGMVGEKDYMDIGLAQDPNYEGTPVMKVVYLGDLNQLPPVGDIQTIIPHDPYWIKLTKIYRQEGNDGLMDPLCELVKFIEGSAPAQPLAATDSFIRGCDLIEEYHNCKDDDKVLLAFTNQRVESLNRLIKGRDELHEMDEVFSPNLREFFLYETWCKKEEVETIGLPWGEDLGFNSKYKTLEHLLSIHDEFAYLQNEDEETKVYAIEFGHYQYKLKMDEFAREAADANKAIEDAFGMGGKTFAQQNKTHPMSRRRAKAWRDYLTYKDCVICVDFPFAMTVHKSQGSTYNYVFVDTQDLYKCATNDYKLFLKLMYVAISRAAKKVYTN